MVTIRPLFSAISVHNKTKLIYLHFFVSLQHILPVSLQHPVCPAADRGRPGSSESLQQLDCKTTTAARWMIILIWW